MKTKSKKIKFIVLGSTTTLVTGVVISGISITNKNEKIENSSIKITIDKNNIKRDFNIQNVNIMHSFGLNSLIMAEMADIGVSGGTGAPKPPAGPMPIDATGTMVAAVAPKSSSTAMTSDEISDAAVKKALNDAKEALDNWVEDMSVEYGGAKAFETRDALIKAAKEKMDLMFASNASSSVDATTFKKYSDQLSKYYKSLLVLEKTRNYLYFPFDETDETSMLNSAPTEGFEKTDLDSLYNQYKNLKDKYDELKVSKDVLKMHHHKLNKYILDPVKKPMLMVSVSKWLAYLNKSINSILETSNPNKIANEKLKKFRDLKDKVTTTFTFVFNFFDYQKTGFVSNPILNANKLRVPINTTFFLEKSLNDLQKGEVKLSAQLFSNLSNEIKELVAYNGLFRVDQVVSDDVKGALSVFLKDPSESNLKFLTTLSDNIKSLTLPALTKSIADFPAELKKEEDMSSWSMNRVLKDLESQTKLSLMKFELVKSLLEYSQTPSNENKEALKTLLSTFDSDANKELLKSILNGDGSEVQKTFSDKYLNAFKTYITKISKPIDLLNSIDKIVVGSMDPNDSTVTVTAENIKVLKEKYLNMALSMVDGSDEATEITNLNTEVMNEALRDYVTGEFIVLGLKKSLKQKIDDKLYEAKISFVKNLVITERLSENEDVKLLQSKLESPDISMILRMFAKTLIDQKALFIGYNDYSLGKSDNFDSVSTLFQTFNVSKTAFDNLASQKDTWTASQMSLYDDLKQITDQTKAEYEFVLALNNYTKTPINSLKTETETKQTALSATFRSSSLFTSVLMVAKTQSDALNTYWNNEKDRTRNAAKINTLEVTNQLLTQISNLTKTTATQPVSSFFKNLEKTVKVVTSSRLVEDQILTLFNYNSDATSGPAFDTTTNKVKDKKVLVKDLVDGNLTLVDSVESLKDAKSLSTVFNIFLDVNKKVDETVSLIGLKSVNGILSNIGSSSIIDILLSGDNSISKLKVSFAEGGGTLRTTVRANDNSRLRLMYTFLAERVNALFLTTELLKSFANTINDFSGASGTPNSNNYDEFVSKFARFSVFLRNWKMDKAGLGRITPGVYDANADFWKKIEAVSDYLKMFHNPADSNSGPMDIVQKFLAGNATRENANRALEPLLRSTLKPVADAAKKILNQFNFGQSASLVPQALRNYLNLKLEENYRKYLGTYIGEFKTNIDQKIEVFTRDFGSSDGSVAGSAWNTTVLKIFEDNITSVNQLRSIFRNVQKYIELFSQVQYMVDTFVKNPNNQKRVELSLSSLWFELDNLSAEIRKTAEASRSSVFTSDLINIAKDLLKIKETQKNKFRLVLGFIQAALSNDLAKMNFAKIENPYETLKPIIGDTFNMYDALGVSNNDGKLSEKFVDGSLFTSASINLINSDVLVYKLLNAKNLALDENAPVLPRDATPEMRLARQISSVTTFAGKNSDYLQMFVNVQRALQSFNNIDLYSAAQDAELKKFQDSLANIKTQIATLNYNKTEVDNDERSLYNLTTITIPNTRITRRDLNIEKILSETTEFLIREVKYGNSANNLVNMPSETNLRAFEEALKSVEDYRINVVDSRSDEQKEAYTKLNELLRKLVDLNSSFDVYKKHYRPSQLNDLMKKSEEINKLSEQLEPLKEKLHVSVLGLFVRLKDNDASVKQQIELLTSLKNLSENLSEQNIEEVTQKITKAKELPAANINNTIEKQMINNVEVAMNVFKSLLDLQTAYNKVDYDGFDIDEKLKDSITKYEAIKTASANSDVLKVFKLWTEKQLVPIQSRWMMDKNLLTYAAYLNEDSENALNISVNNAKKLYEDYLSEYYKFENFTEDQIRSYVELAKEGVETYIFKQYKSVLALSKSAKSFYDIYKISPIKETKSTFDLVMNRLEYLNKLSSIMEKEIEQLKTSNTINDSELITAESDYALKNSTDNMFGTQEREKISNLSKTLVEKRSNLLNKNKMLLDELNRLENLKDATEEQISSARSDYEMSNMELLQFNMLTNPSNEIQKTLNKIITFKMQSLKEKMNSLSDISSYVSAKNAYGQGLNELGKEYSSMMNLTTVAKRLMPVYTTKVSDLEAKISQLKSMTNRSEKDETSLTKLEAELKNAKVSLETLTQRVSDTNLATLQQIKDKFNAMLNDKTSDVLASKVQNNANKVVTQSSELKKSLMKAGLNLVTDDEKFGNQVEKVVEMLNFSSTLLGKYYTAPLELLKEDRFILDSFINGMKAMKEDSSKILSDDLYDKIESVFDTLTNDFNAYNAAEFYISVPTGDTLKNAKSTSDLNKSDARINDVFEKYNNFIVILNGVKTSLNVSSKSLEDNYLELKKSLDNLLLVHNEEEESKITNLQSLLIEKVMARLESFSKEQMKHVDLLSKYVQNPGKELSSSLLEALNNTPAELVTLDNELKVFSSFVSLNNQLKETKKAIEVLVEPGKGLALQLEGILEKEKNNVQSITSDEQIALKISLLNFGSSIIEKSIKEKMNLWATRIGFKQKLLRGLGILDNLFNNASVEAILFNRDVRNIVTTLADELIPAFVAENKARSETVKKLIPNFNALVTELEQDQRTINAIPENTRTQEQKEKLDNANNVLTIIRTALIGFRNLTTQEGTLDNGEKNTLSFLELLENTRTRILNGAPALKTALDNFKAQTNGLIEAVQNAALANRNNKEKLRLLVLKKVFLLVQDEVDAVTSLNADTQLWTGELERNSSEIGTLENELGAIYDTYSGKFISAEEKTKLSENRNKITLLLKALFESKLELDKSEINLRKFLVSKTEKDLGLIEFRKYISDFVASAKLKSEIMIKTRNLEKLNAQLKEHQDMDPATLSNNQKESVARLSFEIKSTKQDITNKQNTINILDESTNKIDEKTILNLSEEDKTEHQKLVDDIKQKRTKSEKDIKDFEKNQQEIEETYKKIVAGANFIQDDKDALTKIEEKLQEVKNKYDENKFNLESVNFYFNTLEIKFEAGLGTQESEELKKREADDKTLEAALEKATADLQTNRNRITDLENWVTNALPTTRRNWPEFYRTLLPNQLTNVRNDLTRIRGKLYLTTIALYRRFSEEMLKIAKQKVEKQMGLISEKRAQIISELSNLNADNSAKIAELRAELNTLESALVVLKTEELNAKNIDDGLENVVSLGRESGTAAESQLVPINQIQNLITNGERNRMPVPIFTVADTLATGYINIFANVDGLEPKTPNTESLTIFKSLISNQMLFERVREEYSSFIRTPRFSFELLLNIINEYKKDMEKIRALPEDTFGGSFKKLYDEVHKRMTWNEFEIDMILNATEAYKDSTYGNSFKLITSINKAKKEFEESESELQKTRSLPMDTANKDELLRAAVKRNNIAKKSKETYELYEKYYPILFKLQAMRNSNDPSEEVLRDIENLQNELKLMSDDDAFNTLKNLRSVIETQFVSLKNRLKNRIDESEFYASLNKFTNNKTLDEFKAFDSLYQKLLTAGFSDLTTFNSIKEAIEATKKVIEVWEASNIEDAQGIEKLKEDIEKALTIVKKGLENTHDFMLNINTLKAMMSVLEFIKQLTDASKTDKTKSALRLSVALENYSINRSNDNLVRLKNAVNVAQRFRISLNGADYISSLIEGINKLKHDITIINVNQKNEQKIAMLKAEHKELEDLQNDALTKQTPTGISKDLFDGIKIDLDNLGLEILLLEGTADGRAINEQLNSFINTITNNTQKATIASLTGLKEKILNLVNLTNVQKSVKAALNEKYEKISNEIMLRDMLEKITSIPKKEQIDEIDKLFSNSLGDLEPLVQLLKVSYENQNKFIEYQSSNEDSPQRIKEMSEDLRVTFQNTLNNSEILARSKNPYFSMIGIQLFRINEANNFLANAESFLLEAIVSKDSEKMMFALDNFEKWERSSHKTNQDYLRLFDLLKDWSKITEESKDGNRSALSKLTNISEELKKLKGVSEVTKHTLNSIITELTDRPFDWTNVIIISVSSAVGFIILSILLYIWIKRRRVEIIRINQDPKTKK